MKLPPRTEEPVSTDSAEQQFQLNSDHLQEAVRLAELRLSEQNTLQAEYERKAILLITSCAAIIGYLFAGDLFATIQSAGWLVSVKILALILLLCAAVKGMRTIEFVKFGVRGIHPAIATKFFEEKIALLKFACDIYTDRINDNNSVLENRAKRLKSAQMPFYLGLAITVASTLIEKVLLT